MQQYLIYCPEVPSALYQQGDARGFEFSRNIATVHYRRITARLFLFNSLHD